jgi:lysozyme
MTIKSMNILQDMLIRHEGLKLKAYLCTGGKLTIGVGRNLEDNGISEDEAFYLLSNDIKKAYQDAESFAWFSSLTEARQIVIIDMMFNLGKNKFSKFNQLLKALDQGDFNTAAKEMISSEWSKQVGKRSIELAAIMKTGSFQK